MNLTKLQADLEVDEGLRLRPYRDSVNKITIGFGHNLDDVPISKRAADVILADDIEMTRNAVLTNLPWITELDDVRQNVLMNMAFNMGIGTHSPPTGLLAFELTLAYVRGGHYEVAAQEMLKSKWSRQVGDRAKRLSEEMRTGEFAS